MDDAKRHAERLREKMTPPTQRILMTHLVDGDLCFDAAFAENYGQVLQNLQTASANPYTLNGVCAAETLDRLAASYQGREGVMPLEAVRLLWEYEHLPFICPMVGPREVHDVRAVEPDVSEDKPEDDAADAVHSTSTDPDWDTDEESEEGHVSDANTELG